MPERNAASISSYASSYFSDTNKSTNCPLTVTIPSTPRECFCPMAITTSTANADTPASAITGWDAANAINEGWGQARALELVEAAKPWEPTSVAEVEGGGRQRRTSVYGAGTDFPRAFSFEVGTGSFLPDDDPRAPRAQAVLGSKLRTELFGNANPLGQRIRVGGDRYRVVGVMAPKGQVLGFDLDGSSPVRASATHDGHDWHITLDRELCQGVFSCFAVCPKACFEKPDDERKVDLAHDELCIRCGACVVQCPQDALFFEDAAGDRIEPAVIRKFKLNLLGARKVDAG